MVYTIYSMLSPGQPPSPDAIPSESVRRPQIDLVVSVVFGQIHIFGSPLKLVFRAFLILNFDGIRRFGRIWRDSVRFGWGTFWGLSCMVYLFLCICLVGRGDSEKQRDNRDIDRTLYVAYLHPQQSGREGECLCIFIGR